MKVWAPGYKSSLILAAGGSVTAHFRFGGVLFLLHSEGVLVPHVVANACVHFS